MTGIYSHVPQNSEFPYIVIEQLQNKTIKNLQSTGLEVEIKISIITKYQSNDLNNEIIEKVKGILSNKQLQIANHSNYPINYVKGNNIKSNDGEIFTCEMLFVCMAI